MSGVWRIADGHVLVYLISVYIYIRNKYICILVSMLLKSVVANNLVYLNINAVLAGMFMTYS